MGKFKKIKKIDSDSIHKKKSSIKSNALNPFEIHVNKEKFKILGRKCKHDKGLPGISRAKAIKKRKETIGREFMQLHKNNVFKDRRVGGGAVANDELSAARFAVEKITQLKTKKKDIFNLNDDEVLTHRGQTLEEIEQFQHPISEESDDEELDAGFTEAAHFGGNGEGTDRKAAIEEMILESKKRKAEIAKEKDEVNELTAELDKNYKELIPLIGKLTKDDDTKKPPQDDYDRMVKEMIFEPRGVVSDKLQSEEEIAKKEKEKLERLEKERLERMKGEDRMEEKPKHRSADDLDDGYFVASNDEDEQTLAYDLDGNKNTRNGTADKLASSDKLADESNEDDFENSEESDEESEDNLSDLKHSDSESDNEDDILQKFNKENSSNKKTDLEQQTHDTLPYTYDMPASYKELYELLHRQNLNQQNIVIERIIKCNHPKLDGNNRSKIVNLFGFLLRYVDEIFADTTIYTVKNTFLVFDRLSPHLYDLIHLDPVKTSEILLDFIKQKQKEFSQNTKMFPPLNTAIFLKLISNVYSTSDFRHPIVTPSFIFISQILTRARTKTAKDVSMGLLLCTISLEYTQLSKRFLPAVFNYLLGIVYLSIFKRTIEIVKISPPFQSSGSFNSILLLKNKVEDSIEEEKLLSTDLFRIEMDDRFKVRALNTTIKLIKEAMMVMTENFGGCYYAEPYLQMLERLDLEKYPDFVKRNYDDTKKCLDSILSKPMKKLVAKEKKPKALRLMEPRIEKVYDDKRRPKMSKEKELRAIMMHKIKNETKGAVREIRRDNAFLTKIKIQQQIQSDLERKEKVKQIFSEAALQQGELNALAKKRKKM